MAGWRYGGFSEGAASFRRPMSGRGWVKENADVVIPHVGYTAFSVGVVSFLLASELAVFYSPLVYWTDHKSSVSSHARAAAVGRDCPSFVDFLHLFAFSTR